MIDPRSPQEAGKFPKLGKSLNRLDVRRRPRLEIDFASRSAALSAMRGSKPRDDKPVENHVLAERLALSRDVLAGHAAILAERGLPIAHVYAAAAAANVNRTMMAIASAEHQEGWPSDAIEDFRAGGLAEWL